MTTGTPLSASSTACARRPADDPAALMRQLQHPTAEDDGQLTGRHMYDRAHTATTPQLGSQDPHSATLGPQLVASWLPASLWATQLVKEQDTHRSCSAMNQDCRSCGTSAAGSFLGAGGLGLCQAFASPLQGGMQWYGLGRLQQLEQEHATQNAHCLTGFQHHPCYSGTEGLAACSILARKGSS